MLHGGEWLAKKYAALAQPRGTQTLETTLTTLASRLQGGVPDRNQAGDGHVPSGPINGRGGPATPTALASLPDRRAAVLSIKGLARDHPAVVGAKALDAILESLCRDAEADDEMARALVEICLTLCEAGTTGNGQAVPTAGSADRHPPPSTGAVHHIDRFLLTPEPLHALLPLLSPKRSFYTRFSALQLLGTLLRIRAPRVQEHVLTAPGGCGAILACLGEESGSSGEIVRNEALLILPRLVEGNADIQKLIAFEGAFERLIDVVALEGRIEGGMVVQDALDALVALLRYNVSNHNYFRETLSIPLLAPLLFFPPVQQAQDAAQQAEVAQQLEAFAFQQWYPPLPRDDAMEPIDDHDRNAAVADESDGQKVINAARVLEVAGILVEGQGDSRRLNQAALLQCGFSRCLVELALASTAPVRLKVQALHVLASLLRLNRPTQEMLSTVKVMPIVRSSQPPFNFERHEARSAEWELIRAAIEGPSEAEAPSSDALAFRAMALECFEAYVNDNLEVRLAILGGLTDAETASHGAGALLLHGLAHLPDSLDDRRQEVRADFDAYRPLFSAYLFAHLVRGSQTAKEVAGVLALNAEGAVVTQERNGHRGTTEDDDDDGRASLIQHIVGNLTMAVREYGEAIRRERSAGGVDAHEVAHGHRGSPTDWTRIQAGYLVLLITWLWQAPNAVAELLRESSNLQVLIQPVSQSGRGFDPLVAGLCAAALGIAYEFCPKTSDAAVHAGSDEGVVTRASLHAILLSRIGPDQFAVELNRLRDDLRFRNTGPDVLYDVAGASLAAVRGAEGDQKRTEASKHTASTIPATTANADAAVHGLWFEWTFVDFVRTNFVLIQRSILVDPHTDSTAQASQSTELTDLKRQLDHSKEQHAIAVREIQQVLQQLEAEQHAWSEERTHLLQRLADGNKATSTTTVADDTDLLAQFEALQRENASLQAQLTTMRQQGSATAAIQPSADEMASGDDNDKGRIELEKELEDLLILLDELSTKRKHDKRRMRQAGLEVSDDEEEEEEREDV